jgi:hypothetical protein
MYPSLVVHQPIDVFSSLVCVELRTNAPCVLKCTRCCVGFAAGWLALLVCVLVASNIAGQNFHYSAASGSSNFFDIVDEASEYFSNSGLNAEELYTDNEYIRFKRWEWYWRSRVNEDGSMTSRPLEDMAPFLDRGEYHENMLIDPI